MNQRFVLKWLKISWLLFHALVSVFSSSGFNGYRGRCHNIWVCCLTIGLAHSFRFYMYRSNCTAHWSNYCPSCCNDWIIGRFNHRRSQRPFQVFKCLNKHWIAVRNLWPLCRKGNASCELIECFDYCNSSHIMMTNGALTWYKNMSSLEHVMNMFHCYFTYLSSYISSFVTCIFTLVCFSP